MKKSMLTILVTLGALGLVACDGGGRGGSGGGSRDSGPIVLMDSGPGRDSGPGGGRDTGPGGMCPSDIVPPPAMPGCDAATRTCLSMCMDNACINNCIMMDSTPSECVNCLDQAIISCANGMGCQDEWDAFVCCAEPACPMGSPPECAMTMCSSQYTGYTGCLRGVMCGGSIGVCFRS